MSHWNVVTACTNLAALYPIQKRVQQNDTLTVALLAFAAGASFISHLFESHKHGSIGFGCSQVISQYLNYVDRWACVLLVPRVVYVACTSLLAKDVFVLACSAAFFVACNQISECDHSARTRSRYLFFHNVWHIGIFLILGHFL